MVTCSFQNRMTGNLIWLMCIVRPSIASNVGRLDPAGRNSGTTSSASEDIRRFYRMSSLEILTYWLHHHHIPSL